MNDYLEEIDHYFEGFFSGVETKSVAVTKSLNNEKEEFRLSYRRLVSIQAWRSEIFEKDGAIAGVEFFREAQNDVLVSHVLARQGAWRMALMAMRSCVENALFSLFYIDHPVERELWKIGEHRLGFTETINYIANHPNFRGLPETFNGVAGLKREYATLSKAVHASASHFRVTKNGEIEGLNVASKAELGAWKTREKACLQNINTLLLVFFKEYLRGSANPNLRNAISLVVGPSKHDDIFKTLGVKLKKIPNN